MHKIPNNSNTPQLLERASGQLRTLKSEVALTFFEGKNADDAIRRVKQLAEKKISALESEVDAALDKHIKMNIDTSTTLMSYPTSKKNQHARVYSKQPTTTRPHEVVAHPKYSLLQIQKFNERQRAKKMQDSLLMTNSSNLPKMIKQEELKNDSTVRKKPILKPVSQMVSKAVPLEIRKNPFAVLPPLSMNDLDRGIYTLVNQGYLPKYIDILPALQRNDPLFHTKPVLPNVVIYNDSILDLNIDESKLYQTNNPTPSQSASIAYPQSRQAELAKPAIVLPNPQGDSLITIPKSSPIVLPSTKQKTHPDLPPQENTLQTRFDLELVKKARMKLIEVSNGQLTKDDAFVKFRSQNLAHWGDVQEAIDQIVNHCVSVKILSFGIYTQKLIEHSSLMRDLTIPEIKSCVENYDKILQFVGSVTTSKKDPNRFTGDYTNRYIIKIQKNYRRLIAARLVKRLNSIKRKLSNLQLFLKLKHVYHDTVKKTEAINKDRYKQFLAIQKKFVDIWETISKGERVEIHLNSLNYDQATKMLTMDYIGQQNSQISRIFRLVDPYVHIILVCPIPLPLDILAYYVKMLEINGVQDVERRLHYVTPCYYEFFKDNLLSLSCLLRLSSDTLNYIKKLVGDKPAYFIGGYPSLQDINLSVLTGIPFLSGDPVENNKFLSGHCVRRLSHDYNIPYLEFSRKITRDTEFEPFFAQLIASKPQYSSWKMEIEGEFGGRGSALITVDVITAVQTLRNIPEEKDRLAKQADLVPLLKKFLPGYSIISCPRVFSTFQQFKSLLVAKGGYITAVPKAKIKTIGVVCWISPQGGFRLITSYEYLQTDRFYRLGYLWPQREVSTEEGSMLETLTRSIAQCLFTKKKVYGFVTLLFTAAAPPGARKLRFCLDRIVPYFDEFMAAFEMITLMAQPENLHIPSKSVVFIPRIQALRFPAELNYLQFFERCRERNVFFDLKARTGTMFTLCQPLAKGSLGLVVVDSGEREAVLKSTSKALVGLSTLIDHESPDLSDDRNDCLTHQTLMEAMYHIIKNN